MTEARFLVGIDGGGSTVRVAVAAPALDVVSQSECGAANPSAIGREVAATSIRETMRAALHAADHAPRQVAPYGIGEAGAAKSHSIGCSRKVWRTLPPRALVVPRAED